jgi:hypothetical protein
VRGREVPGSPLPGSFPWSLPPVRDLRHDEVVIERKGKTLTLPPDEPHDVSAHGRRLSRTKRGQCSLLGSLSGMRHLGNSLAAFPA